MLTKLQLKSNRHAENDISLFEEGKIYNAVAHENLLMIDCDGSLVVECISEIKSTRFDIISSLEVERTEVLLIDELTNFDSNQSVDRFVPVLVG